MKSLLHPILLLLVLSACQQQTDQQQANDKIVDHSIASLYPIGKEWIELQNLEKVNNANKERNYKTSILFTAPLKTEVYRQWCGDGNCFQFNAFNELEMIPQEDLISENAQEHSLNFLFPIKNGWVTATSLENENIYSIKFLDHNLQEQWSTIYKKSKIDEENNWIDFAHILGYNDHLLIFNSTSEQYKRSAYIDLHTGNKVQKDEQWVNILIDTDQKTVLGRLIENEDGSYSLKVGSTYIDLSVTAHEYPSTRLLLSDNNILVAFHHPQSKTAQLLCYDYHTAETKWEQSIVNNSPIKNITLSDFKDLFMIETNLNASNESHQLYIFLQDEGLILGKF